MAFHSGFVAVVGRANVGKSTLVNRLVGEKVSITSDKPQTTRNRILAVLNQPDAQIVFMDTPGIHKPRHLLGERMVRSAEQAFSEVEVILFVVDAAAGPPGPGDRRLAERLAHVTPPVVLVLNKMDAMAPARAAKITTSYRELGDFVHVITLSALTGENLGSLMDIILPLLPEGPRYFPADMLTDQPERFLMSELIREKVLRLTREEVPHAVAVDVESIQPRKDDLLYVQAVIYIERESQKGIIVGERGAMLKEIGSLARRDIEALLGSRVYLDLWVKVKRDWRNREGSLQMLGYQDG
ncbi:MAG: GTPase Era [Thermaerobacterales bacterium]